ncbi:MAG: magnesium/cobalt transporter CorA [Chromatiaceae bacterium]|nr:magnesium/cobalt transporter CorA [Chromatiaceae bacterium]
MAYFNKRYHPPGTAPGTLRELPPSLDQPVHVRQVRYSRAAVKVNTETGALPLAPSTEIEGVTWLHVQGHPSRQLLTEIGERYQVHPLALEDIDNTGQRPKVEAFDRQVFAILSVPRFSDGRVEVQQASCVLGKGLVLSFCGGTEDPFLPVLKRLQDGASRFRSRGADYLLYALLDTVVDQGFPVLEAFGLELEELEEKILLRPSRETLPHIHAVKRELILLRRMLWPQREVLNALVREEQDLIKDDTRVFLRDCYDHTVQVMDLLETYRDMSASMLDIYLSSVSNRMNEIMRVLTVIATIFIPLTFIVGVYGMNFGANTKSPWAMPELNWYYGYPLIWLLMLAVAVGMMIYFWRKRWL